MYMTFRLLGNRRIIALADAKPAPKHAPASKVVQAQCRAHVRQRLAMRSQAALERGNRFAASHLRMLAERHVWTAEAVHMGFFHS